MGGVVTKMDSKRELSVSVSRYVAYARATSRVASPSPGLHLLAVDLHAHVPVARSVQFVQHHRLILSKNEFTASQSNDLRPTQQHGRQVPKANFGGVS